MAAVMSCILLRERFLLPLCAALVSGFACVVNRFCWCGCVRVLVYTFSLFGADWCVYCVRVCDCCFLFVVGFCDVIFNDGIVS